MFQPVDPEKAREFENQRKLEIKMLNDMSDKYMTCRGCGFQCRTSEAKNSGWTACPQCGNNQCVVTDLPYNTHDPNGIPIPVNPPPTPEEIAYLDRLQAPGRAK